MQYGVHTKPIKITDELLNLPDDKLCTIMSKVITDTLGEAIQEVRAKNTRNWLIVSHTLTRLDNRLLLTLLVRAEPNIPPFSRS